MGSLCGYVTASEDATASASTTARGGRAFDWYVTFGQSIPSYNLTIVSDSDVDTFDYDTEWTDEE